MKNKNELKKTIIKSIVLIFLMLILYGVYQYYQYRVYTINFNNKINSIITKIIQEYPNIDKNDLMKMINDENDENKNILKEYGIELDKDAVILKNNRYFIYFMVSNLTLMIFLSISILIIYLNYNKNKDKRLNEITKYIQEINNKNYKLDIEDNTEDELSILKNELYKITIMLKETAENSKEDKIKLKDSLSDISHQLKTPLTSITIMIDNVLDNPNMEQDARTDFLKNIRKQIININFLINSLLKLSKLDVNSVNFINQEEYIENIINQSINNVSIICELKNIKININGDKKSKVYCDFKWQIEAITNILKNAIEHSKTNSKIDINFEQNEIYSKIEIRDYGSGIDSKDLPHIFERFYKGKNSSNDSIGIGLALSKSIIEKNNGKIEVDSKINEGTIFIIRYF